MTFTGATSFATAIVSLLVKLRTLSVHDINLNLHVWRMLLFGCFFIHLKKNSLLFSWFLSSCVERQREKETKIALVSLPAACLMSFFVAFFIYSTMLLEILIQNKRLK